MDYMAIGIGAATGIIIGLIIGKFLFAPNKKEREIVRKETDDLIASARKESELIKQKAITESEGIKKDRILEAKEKFLQMKAEVEQERREKVGKLEEQEARMRNRENQLAQEKENYKKKEAETENVRNNLSRQLELVNIRKQEMDKAYTEHVSKLEQIAQLTAEEAKTQLIETLKDEARNKAMAYVKEIIEEAKLKANKESKKIILQTIQRTAAEQTIENTVSVFNLDSDDQKGQIIGREGRNIRALEAATGVELIVDDTPETIIISGFDPVRREIARLSLQRLVADGRIHPARIEEIVAKTKKQLDEHIVEIGERTVIELGISGLHTELVRIVGRMRFRSSYGQNLLMHSKEVANLCAVMAAEMGLNPKIAKRAGLLHDIGKVPEEESELSHALLGAKLCEKYGENPAIVNAVGAHHDELEMTYVISPIVQACDAISGARPGARREILESYLKRIKEMETLALAYDGVEKVFAIQAGRELRVIVEADKVDDKKSEDLSFAIAQKIQDEMQYPGHIKVTVIRETRAISYAK
ncbi:MAG: ribonuclease Y [Bacteroidetes bacterium]|nr:ribonuclease Y [Bacteroidota bacterium]MBK7108908.1 ribonuclease Y [Bacteroidota bacterium]MBK8488766.1 ribonuclease Y [Bacteroidota bacterium]MBK8681477.1 ribonuclease Y [Bacteroidota bacterium]